MEPVDAAQNETSGIKCKIHVWMHGGAESFVRDVDLQEGYGVEDLQEEIADAFQQNSYMQIPVTAALGDQLFTSSLYLNVQQLLSIEVLVH